MVKALALARGTKTRELFIPLVLSREWGKEVPYTIP